MKQQQQQKEAKAQNCAQKMLSFVFKKKKYVLEAEECITEGTLEVNSIVNHCLIIIFMKPANRKTKTYKNKKYP